MIASFWKVVEDNFPQPGAEDAGAECAMVVAWSDGLMASITPQLKDPDRTYSVAVVNTGHLPGRSPSHVDRQAEALRLRTMAMPVLGVLLGGSPKQATWYLDPTQGAGSDLTIGFRANAALTFRSQLADIRLWFRPDCKGVGDAWNK